MAIGTLRRPIMTAASVSGATAHSIKRVVDLALSTTVHDFRAFPLARRRRCVLHPALGLLVLIVVTVLNVHKPRGLTPYGQHKHAKELKSSTRNRATAGPIAA
jgi:hypothetical protein